MVLIPNGETWSPGASGTVVTRHNTLFKKRMDSVLLGGRDILIDLPPSKTPCTSADCKYNPTYDHYVGVNGAICRDCRGQGYDFTHRQVTYKCNRRWTSEPQDRPLAGKQNTEGGRIYANFVRVKTHIASYDFILSSVGATIDDQKVKLFQEPRKTGWNDEIYYVISWWQKANKTDG